MILPTESSLRIYLREQAIDLVYPASALLAVVPMPVEEQADLRKAGLDMTQYVYLSWTYQDNHYSGIAPLSMEARDRFLSHSPTMRRSAEETIKLWETIPIQTIEDYFSSETPFKRFVTGNLLVTSDMLRRPLESWEELYPAEQKENDFLLIEEREDLRFVRYNEYVYDVYESQVLPKGALDWWSGCVLNPTMLGSCSNSSTKITWSSALTV